MSKATDWIWMKGHVDPTRYWDVDEIKSLRYNREEFNDTTQLNEWKEQGFSPRTGQLFDMRYLDQPKTTELLSNWAYERSIENIGISYYAMETGDNLPYHKDTYKRYIKIYELEERTASIVRYIFFVEDRKPGHLLEIDGTIVDWKAGDYVAWRYDTPHMAANLGLVPRYTIQLTGVLREGI
jgi:hypothetical protein